jgi:hypothetical protein
MFAEETAGLEFYHNTFRADNGGNCMRFGYGCSNVIIKNNLLSNYGDNSDFACMNLEYSVSGLTLNWNCYYNHFGASVGYDGNFHGTLSSWQSSSYQDDNSIAGDPGFQSVNFYDSNYLHINSSSICRDTGTSGVGGNGLDFEKQTRDSKPDIGADEFGTLKGIYTDVAGNFTDKISNDLILEGDNQTTKFYAYGETSRNASDVTVVILVDIANQRQNPPEALNGHISELANSGAVLFTQLGGNTNILYDSQITANYNCSNSGDTLVAYSVWVRNGLVPVPIPTGNDQIVMGCWTGEGTPLYTYMPDSPPNPEILYTWLQNNGFDELVCNDKKYGNIIFWVDPKKSLNASNLPKYFASGACTKGKGSPNRGKSIWLVSPNDIYGDNTCVIYGYAYKTMEGFINSLDISVKASWSNIPTKQGLLFGPASSNYTNQPTITSTSDNNINVSCGYISRYPIRCSVAQIGRFEGNFSLSDKSVAGQSENFSVCGIQGHLVIKIMEQIGFNDFRATISMDNVIGGPDSSFSNNTNIAQSEWQIGSSKINNNSTEITTIITPSSALLYRGKYKSTKSENECWFSVPLLFDYARDIENNLALRLSLRPTKDDITSDYGDNSTTDQSIRAYIKLLGSAQYEPLSWGGNAFNYQNEDQIVMIEAQVKDSNGSARQGVEVFFRVVDPPDAAPYSDNSNWWLPRGNNDNGDGSNSVFAINENSSGSDPDPQPDYPLGNLIGGNRVGDCWKSSTDPNGIARIKLKGTDHVSGDNYYVLASLVQITNNDIISSNDYALLKCGKQRTGLITAWKQYALWNCGMNNSSGIPQFCCTSIINDIYKPAFIYFVEKNGGCHVYNDNVAVLSMYTSESCFSFSPELNNFPLFYIENTSDPSANRLTIRGISISPPVQSAFVFSARTSKAPSNIARIASHEICHAFLLIDSPYGFLANGTDAGHDFNGGYKGASSCVMTPGGSDEWCFRHLQALRRQLYDVGFYWRQEKD